MDLRDPASTPDLKHEFQLRSEGIQINQSMTPIIEQLNPIFHGGSGQLTGVGRAAINAFWSGPIPFEGDRIAAATNSLTGNGGMFIENLQMGTSPFLTAVFDKLGSGATEEPGEFTLPEFFFENGTVRYEMLRVRAKGLDLMFRGRVYLDGRLHLTMFIPISEKFLEKNPKWAPLVGTTLEVPVRGTIAEPSFEWDNAISETVKRAAENKIEKEAERRLEKILKDLLKP
jgi:hypothetical protein